MHFTTLLTGAAALSSASASVITKRQNTPSGQCATGVHLIVVGGANSTNPYDDGRLATTRDSILRAIPGSTHATAPYDKVEPRNGQLNPGAVPAGEQNFNQYISSYAQSCPDTKIVTMSYSAGSIITQLAMCTGLVSQQYAPNPIIANILFGDQSRVPGQPYNRGTCVANGGKHQLANPAGCGNFATVTASWCDINDPQCCGGPPEDYPIHLSYPSKYTGAATEFARQQFMQSGGSLAAGDSSSSMTASTVATDSAAGAATASATASASASASASVSASESMSSSMASSMASAFLSSASAAQSQATSSAAAAATSAASAASSATSAAGGFAGAATESAASAGGAATSAAASGAGAASTATSTPAAYNPNGSGMVIPSTSLINAILVGMMVLIGATML